MTWFRHATRHLLVALGVVGVLGVGGQPARAASVPAGFQEYYVLGHEGHVYNMFNRPVLGQFPLGYALSGGMISTVSVTASSDNQVIYYDQWENGFEADIFSPTQTGSTLVFGNGVASDGRACDYIASRACTGVAAVDDAISRGETLNLSSSSIPSGNTAAPNCAAGGLTACVPIPRSAADVRFDGGDRLVASGGPVTLVHVQEPTANLTGILGGAVEILPLQAVQGATSYSVPVGENTFSRFGGTGTAGMPFRFVDLDLVAFEDNTAVQVTSPGAGTVNFVLNRGQHWSSQGAIDLGAGPALVINEGTKISVNKPVAGLIFASSTNYYGTRVYALLPDLLHSNDYVITAPGDDTSVNGTSVHDLYVYNPNPAASITVTATDSLGSNSFLVPANTMLPYTVATGRSGVPANSTVRLSSAANFWGISAYDSRNTAFDWGHSWLAVDFLTGSYAIPYAPDSASRTLSPPSAAAAPGSAGAGATPAFAAATADNTCIRVDFNNDGTFDQVRNGAGALVAFSGGACADGYVINALQALRIYDNNAADGTLNNNVSGARVEASKPIAMAYGIDTDSSPTSGPGLLDLGYAIYPVDQRFLNPVLTIDKSTDRSTVPSNLAPGAGTLVTYTLAVQAYAFDPLNNLSVTDLLASQVSSAGACVDAAGPGSGYVCNSTVITYPDLSTESGAAAEPILSLPAPGTRDKLTWDATAFAPKAAQLLKNETLLIEYEVRVESGPSELLRNDATADASLGASSVFFTPTASASVVRTDVSLAKAVTDDGTPESGDVLTYTMTVSNDGIVSETGITVTDPLPAHLTYVPASVTSAAGLTGSFSAGQNAVTWTGSLAPGASAVVSFQATINALTDSGTQIHNTATYESNQTEVFSSNAVTTTVVAPDLGGLTKTILGNPAVVHPGEILTYEVVVANDGATAANNVLITDPISSLATYVPGSIKWKLNAATFATLTDASDGLESGADGRAVDTGAPAGADQVELRVPTLGPGEDITLRFKVQVNNGTGGQTLNNAATVQADNFAAADASLVQVVIDGDATVTGHLFLDLDDSGTQDPGEPDLPNVDVTITDEDGFTQTVVSDGNGDWVVVVPADSGGSTTVDVDETDPDFPSGAMLCSAGPACTDPQTGPSAVTAVAGNTVAAADTGYVPPEFTVSKTSDAGGAVSPGDLVTYTIQVTNNTGVTHTHVTVEDALPTGTSYVTESTTLTIPAIIDTFRDAFTTVGGSGGSDNAGTRNFAGGWVEFGEGDGFGAGDIQILAVDGSTRLRLQNGASGGEGAYRQVDLSGYQSAILSLDVRRNALDLASDFATVAVCDAAVDACDPLVDASGWTVLDSYAGPGNDTGYQHRRYAVGASFLSAAMRLRFRTSTGLGGADQIYVDNVQIAASNSALEDFADGVNSQTFAANNGVNGSFSGAWVEGGEADGAAAGNVQAIADQTSFRLRVQGAGSSIRRSLDLSGYDVVYASLLYRRDSLEAGNSVDFKVDNGGAPVTFESFAGAGGGLTDAAYTYTRHDVSLLASATTTLTFDGAALDNFGGGDRVFIDEVEVLAAASPVRTNQAADSDKLDDGVATASPAGPNLVVALDDVTLAPGATLTVTYQVLVDDPLTGAVTQITNTATVNSDQASSPASDTVSDAVLHLDVGVEPNSAGTVVFSASAQTFTFLHAVTNHGQSTDSYALRAFSALGASGWSVSLVNPSTGTVIATDSNGDGVWNGGVTPNTGSLAAGASRSYRLRVTVPGAAAVGVSDLVTLEAVSDLNGAVTGSARDTVTVTDGSVTGAGDLLVTPDNASFVPQSAAPTSVVYTHTVTNLTGGTRAFQLQANSSQGFTTHIYRDTNGDGVYTAGVDVAIVQTASLANTASQRVFVVVDVPASTPANTVDVVSVAASFFNDGGTPGNISDDVSFGGTATDTTTVTPAGDSGNNALGFTLSGGGTRVVIPGATAVFPGELSNLGDATDIYEFSISPSTYSDGQPDDDNLPHASALVLDTDGNGVIDGSDLVVATDGNGDGVWDSVNPAFDEDGDGNPDIAVAVGAITPYELRRAVDSGQGPYADVITLTATSKASGSTDAVSSTTSVQAPTLALVDELVAYAAPGGAYVQWSTLSEQGTVGFTLERLDERRGRWLRVNPKLLPALLHSRFGAVYRLRDKAVRAGDPVTYRLLELEATGATLEHGPYEVLVAEAGPPADTQGRADEPLPGYERVARSMDHLSRARAERKAAARQAAALRKARRRGPVVKVGVVDPGMYRLSAERIAAAMDAGVDEVRHLIGKRLLALRWHGARVPVLTEGDEAILFYGAAVDSRYTSENVYQLSRGKTLPMRSVNARSPAPVSGQTFPYTAHAEGNRYYLTHLFDDPDGDYWMWDFRFEDMLFPSNETSFPVPTPDVAGVGTATVTVRLHGGLEALHRARITVHGAVDKVVDTEWHGLTPHVLSFDLDASDLADGENRIEIQGLGSGDADRPSTFYINDMDISYLRRQVAVDGALATDHEPGRVTSIDGFAGADIMVFDVTRPRRVRRLTHLTVESTAAGMRVSLRPKSRSVHRVLALEPAALKEPTSLSVDEPSLLKRRDHSVDWLLITSADMMDAAGILADHRKAQGLRTLVVDIEDVYDEFAWGTRDADAIWRLLEYAHRKWRVAPRYVVLAGEGSFDYKDYLGNGDSIIPTLLAPTADGLYPSDNLFADVTGNDFLPDMAIGRLPVIDAAELEAVSRKIIAYEASSGDWTHVAVFGADPEDAGGDFAASSAGVRAVIPDGAVDLEVLDVDPLTLPAGVARTQLQAALNEGRAFFNFFGHAATGSIGNLAPGLINADDLLSPGSPLANGANLPVVTAFTCLVGQFGAPGTDGVGELMVLSPDRGAAAVFSPSGLSRNALARTLGEDFYRATYGEGERVIGDAILRAQALYAQSGGDRYLLDIYNLLGDPATIMK